MISSEFDAVLELESGLEESDAGRTIVAPVPFVFVSDYRESDVAMGSLYQKSQQLQWSIDDDLDWRHELNYENPLGMPDGGNPIFGTEIWNKMTGKEKRHARQHFQSWQMSQILHSEQASLFCAAKIAQASPNLATKLCVSLQVCDEARHVNVYSRLINTKLPYFYPLSKPLKTLFDDTIRQQEYDYAALGMQILVEGMALGFLRAIHAHSTDPFISKIHGLVVRDEARHFAIGRAELRDFYSQLSFAEISQREEYVAASCELLNRHFCAEEVWEPIGLPIKECSGSIRVSKITQEMRRTMMRQIVPALKDIGLLGPKLTQYFTRIDAIDYARFPV